MKEQYFEVYNGEDGVCIKKIDDINEYLDTAADLDEEEHVEFLSDFPEIDKKHFDAESELYATFIIKGRIVVPKKKEVVTRYEIE